MQQLNVGDEVHYRGRNWGVVEVARGRVKLRCGGAYSPFVYASARPGDVRFVRGGSARSRRRADEQPEFGEKEAEALVRRVVDQARRQAAAERDTKVTAAHEAGHAVAAALLGMTVQAVVTDPEVLDGHGARGMTMADYYPDDVPVEDVVVHLLAGGLAARMLCGDDGGRGCGKDEAQARALLGGPVPDALRSRAAEFVEAHRAEVEAVVELAARPGVGVVLGCDVHDVCRDGAGPGSYRPARRRAGTGVLEERVTFW